MVPEDADYYLHTLEGPDDMTSHIKTSILGNSLTIPITNGELNLGTWQGIYLCLPVHDSLESLTRGAAGRRAPHSRRKKKDNSYVVEGRVRVELFLTSPSNSPCLLQAGLLWRRGRAIIFRICVPISFLGEGSGLPAAGRGEVPNYSLISFSIRLCG